MCARLKGRSLPPRCHDCGAAVETGGKRCARCRVARAPRDHEQKKKRAEDRFPSSVRTALLEQLRNGVPLREACEALKVPSQRPFGWRTYQPEWAEALDAALLEGRDPGLDHGSLRSYRRHGCRCPECREAKARSRGQHV